MGKVYDGSKATVLVDGVVCISTPAIDITFPLLDEQRMRDEYEAAYRKYLQEKSLADSEDSLLAWYRSSKDERKAILKSCTLERE